MAFTRLKNLLKNGTTANFILGNNKSQLTGQNPS